MDPNNRPPANQAAGDFANNNATAPPPLPARPAAAPLDPYNSPMSMPYNSINSPYNSYGGLYNSGGMYGMNASPYSMNRFGYGGPPVHQETSFVRLAEESSRNAFQSVESVVQAVSSVSFMLESTLTAVYSSFRAVLGVADQFGRMKTQMSQVVGAFALIRWLKWLYRRLLVLIGLKPANYANFSEMAWSAASTPSAAELLGNSKGTNWPSLIFFVLAIGGPYLIWKLINTVVSSVEESKKWVSGEAEHYEAKAVYDFNAVNQSELSLRQGDVIRIAPKHSQPTVRGWLLAAKGEEDKIGLVPINYVEIVGKREGQSMQRSQERHREHTPVNFDEEFNDAQRNI